MHVDSSYISPDQEYRHPDETRRLLNALELDSQEPDSRSLERWGGQARENDIEIKVAAYHDAEGNVWISVEGQRGGQLAGYMSATIEHSPQTVAEILAEQPHILGGLIDGAYGQSLRSKPKPVLGQLEDSPAPITLDDGQVKPELGI